MTDINIIVCAKQIPDPEAPLSDVSVDGEKMEVIVDAPMVISPFDENALEVAVRLKDDLGGRVTVLSLGKKVSDTVLRKSLAAGADELILLQDDPFEKLDSYSTAAALADAVRKVGDFDLVLTGRQAGDWDSGQVGLILGEMLELPCINLVFRNINKLTKYSAMISLFQRIKISMEQEICHGKTWSYPRENCFGERGSRAA